MTDNKHPTPPPQTPPKPEAIDPAQASLLKDNYAVETKPLAPPGSRDYVAGQPVDEDEQKKVDEAAAARLKAAAEAASKHQAEQKAAAQHPDTQSKR